MTIHNPHLFKLIQKFPFLSKLFTITDGLIIEPEDERDFIFGANTVDKVVLREDGQWLNFLPEDELQRGRRVETMGCTGYALLNVLEMVAKLKWGKQWNKSDRFTNKMSGTGRNGNSLSRVLESVRKYHGVVKEVNWPWSRDNFTWNDYYSGIPLDIQDIGTEWLENYGISYERVTYNKQLLMESLKYSPLYVAGYAWYQRKGLYQSYSTANHAFTIVGYVEGSHWLAYDSYSPHIKKLAWDFYIPWAYVVTLKKESDFNVAEIQKLLDKGIKYIMRALASGQLYELTPEGLKYITPEEARDLGIKMLAVDKKLIGIPEDYYNKLNND